MNEKTPAIASGPERIEAARQVAALLLDEMVIRTPWRRVRELYLDPGEPERLIRRVSERPAWDHALDPMGGIFSFNPARAPR